jgi:hypothetical protein
MSPLPLLHAVLAEAFGEQFEVHMTTHRRKGAWPCRWAPEAHAAVERIESAGLIVVSVDDYVGWASRDGTLFRRDELTLETLARMRVVPVYRGQR